MESFRCYDNSDVTATLIMPNFHLNTTVVAVFPNVCLWRRSLCSDLVLTLKNCIEPPSYARTAYVVAMWPLFLFDSSVNIWATCEMFLSKWFTAPPGKKFPVRLWKCCSGWQYWSIVKSILKRYSKRNKKLLLLRDEGWRIHKTLLLQHCQTRITCPAWLIYLKRFPFIDVDVYSRAKLKLLAR